MSTKDKGRAGPLPADILLGPDPKRKARTIWTVRKGQEKPDLAELPTTARAWLEATAWKVVPGKVALVPSEAGGVAGAVLGLGPGSGADRMPLAAGALPGALPEGAWSFAGPLEDPRLATVAFGMGAYRFERYKEKKRNALPSLVCPKGVDRDEAVRIVEGLWRARDLINTPASDLGPEDLAAAAIALAKEHGAKSSVIVGEALLEKSYPMIHAVGRASSRPPCLVDISWSRKEGRKDAPRITLIGKGICFDTGGLDIKPSSAMLLMKKDMGGAAAALALGHMIMGARLDVRLRILLSCAENSISGNAFRPGDVLQSRAGTTVEIGNTDAEGRLVLADALALADEEKPDIVMTFATLTGAARVALGPELPAMFATDDALAAEIEAAGLAVGDPCWRMPFWPGYERMLESQIADVNHVSDGPFAGSVTAALFLKRFVKQAKAYVHFDMFAWVPSERPGQPKGGEAQMARALYEVLKNRLG
jgi:leucyl aminopeptidase